MEAILWVIGIGVSVVVGLIVWLIIRSSRKADAKYAELWGRLTGQVNGTSKGNRMSGTYRGTPVTAQIKSISINDETTYYYDLSMTIGRRGEDWSVRYGGEKLFGSGEQRWHVTAEDDALKARLVAARVVELVAVQPQHAAVKHKAERGTLVYQEAARGAFDVPAPGEFKAHLELLARLADVNRQVNI